MVLGVGVDVVEVERLRKLIARHGRRFLRRVFTAREIAWCGRRAQPEVHYAARFAAKEAVLKALGTGWSEGLAFTQVEVRRARSGAPSVVLTGAARARARKAGAARFHLSLSHDAGVAVAFVLAESDRR